MTNMTQAVSRPSKGLLEQQQYGMVGYTDRGGGSEAYTAYKGAVMIIDVSDIDGYVLPHQSGITSAGGDVFVGFAEETVSVVAADTAQGDKKIVVRTTGLIGVPLASFSGVAVTDIGAPVYASDDTTFTTTSSNNQWVGTLRNVDATNAWIDISHASGRANTAT